MTPPRDGPLLAAVASRAMSAFSAIVHTADGDADMRARLRLLDDPKLGFTADERAVLRVTGPRVRPCANRENSPRAASQDMG